MTTETSIITAVVHGDTWTLTTTSIAKDGTLSSLDITDTCEALGVLQSLQGDLERWERGLIPHEKEMVTGARPGGFIGAIKAYRTRTGASLFWARTVCDGYRFEQAKAEA